MFETRSQKLERIDTGDCTPEEYDRFLSDIQLVNRFAGDNRALRRTLLREVEKLGLNEFSVLDVGAGSGQVLRTIARRARREGHHSSLVGLELNARSARLIGKESVDFQEIRAVQGDALRMPFADRSFDYVISSLFAHHLKDDEIATVLKEMSRVSRRGVYLIDLHRHPMALVAYKAFCAAFRISRLVREDGSLSILRGFKTAELGELAKRAGLANFQVIRSAPFRLVLCVNTND